MTLKQYLELSFFNDLKENKEKRKENRRERQTQKREKLEEIFFFK